MVATVAISYLIHLKNHGDSGTAGAAGGADHYGVEVCTVDRKQHRAAADRGAVFGESWSTVRPTVVGGAGTVSGFQTAPFRLE